MRENTARHARFRAVVALCLSLSLVLGAVGSPVDAQTATPPYGNADFMRGFNYVSPLIDDFASRDSERIVSEFMKPVGANWVAIVVNCYQTTVASRSIICLPYENKDGSNPWFRYTVPDATVARAVATAKAQGMKVMLKPHVDLLEDTRWRGEIGYGKDERAWAEWFASYRGFITKYAALAKETGADALVVGTELVNTNRDASCDANGTAAKRSKDWRGVVAAVRAIYAGKLYYAANWGFNECGEDVQVDWWDAIDAIGIDAYYGLAPEQVVTVPQLVESWRVWVTRIEEIQRRYNKPVILTEIGFQSRIGGHNRRTFGTAVLNIQDQTDSYEATMQAFAGKPWLAGMFWWAVEASSDPVFAGGVNDTNFTPRGKPAADILRRYWVG